MNTFEGMHGMFVDMSEFFLVQLTEPPTIETSS